MTKPGRPRRSTCVRCERNVAECGTLSSRGRCYDCGRSALVETLDQLHGHSGPRFDYWRRRLLAAFGVQAPERKEVDDDA